MSSKTSLSPRTPTSSLLGKRGGHNFPLLHLFTVSSLKSIQSVQCLLTFVTEQCDQIFNKHTTQIPTSYHSFLLQLQHHSKESPLMHWGDLHTTLGKEFKMDKVAFKCMLKYIQSIGRIVWLPTGWVFTDPTLAPKIAAKFVSPREVRLALLKQDTDKVQILDSTEVGCLLDIDTSDNDRYCVVDFYYDDFMISCPVCVLIPF
jgi:hypothetical protein